MYLTLTFFFLLRSCYTYYKKTCVLSKLKLLDILWLLLIKTMTFQSSLRKVFRPAKSNSLLQYVYNIMKLCHMKHVSECMTDRLQHQTYRIKHMVITPCFCCIKEAFSGIMSILAAKIAFKSNQKAQGTH